MLTADNIAPKPVVVVSKTILILFFLILISTVASVSAYIYIKTPQKILTPLSTVTQALGFSTQKQTEKIIYGFLPYWLFKSEGQIRYDLITHLALFGATIDSEGNFITKEKTYTEPGWAALNSDRAETIKAKAKIAGTKVILTLIAFDSVVTDKFLSDPKAWENLANNTLALTESDGYDGINIDFEYVDNATEENRKSFTEFVKYFSEKIKSSHPEYHISIDVFSDASLNDRIWEIDQISQYVDHIIIMAYDYHRPSSEKSGPVAPIYGEGELWDKDIVSALEKFTKLTPAYKYLLGVPYYGYEWQTTTTSPQSTTYRKTGSIATYKRVNDLIAENRVQSNWNPHSLSPWISYQEDGKNWQIYYEDFKSLSIKYDLANQAGLDGIAIWALGYDGGAPELWQLIEHKFY